MVFYLAVLLLLCNSVQSFPDPEPRFITAKIGRRFRLDYNGPELIYQRCTSASPDRQFAFRVKGFDGWTTNGWDRIDENSTRIYPNGTLEIDEFKTSDHGVYSYPTRADVCPLHVYTTLNGWIQDCEPNTYEWVYRNKQTMNHLQSFAHKNPRIQLNRGAYNYRTRLYSPDEAVFEVELGSTVRLDFGAEHFVISRVTDQIESPQLIFSINKFIGWTIDGTDRFDTDRTRLYPNGTLIIKNFKRTDVGKYSRPLEPLRTIQPPMYYLLELPGFINLTTIWPEKSKEKVKEKPKKFVPASVKPSKNMKPSKKKIKEVFRKFLN